MADYNLQLFCVLQYTVKVTTLTNSQLQEEDNLYSVFHGDHNFSVTTGHQVHLFL